MRLFLKGRARISRSPQRRSAIDRTVGQAAKKPCKFAWLPNVLNYVPKGVQITANVVAAGAAVALVCIGLYWNSEADRRQKKAVQVDRTVAMYHNFMNDRQINQLMIFTDVSRAVSTAKTRVTFEDEADKELSESDMNLFRQTANNANLDIFNKYFPVEQFSAFDKHVEAINNCLFGPAWINSGENDNFLFEERGRKLIIKNDRLAARFEKWSEPKFNGKRDWIFSDDTACDTVTVFSLYGPTVNEIFYANRGVIYCSALYDSKRSKVSGVELFVAAYAYFAGTIRGEEKPAMEDLPGLKEGTCSKKEWQDWQNNVPSLADRILAARGIPPEIQQEMGPGL